MAWRDVAEDNRTAANELFIAHRWRRCTSRAYYAAYAATTHALLQVPIQMPSGKEGPAHIPLPQIIGNNLTLLEMDKRWHLADLMHRVYELRLLADYRPSVAVEEEESRIAMGLMGHAFRLLETFL